MGYLLSWLGVAERAGTSGSLFVDAADVAGDGSVYFILEHVGLEPIIEANPKHASQFAIAPRRLQFAEYRAVLIVVLH